MGVLGGILALLILVFVLLVAISFFVVCKVNGLRLVNREVSLRFTENKYLNDFNDLIKVRIKIVLHGHFFQGHVSSDSRDAQHGRSSIVYDYTEVTEYRNTEPSTSNRDPNTETPV